MGWRLKPHLWADGREACLRRLGAKLGRVGGLRGGTPLGAGSLASFRSFALLRALRVPVIFVEDLSYATQS
jgi:hypothetical protein